MTDIDEHDIRVSTSQLEWLFHAIRYPSIAHKQKILQNTVQWFIKSKNPNFQRTGHLYYQTLNDVKTDKELQRVLYHKIIPIFKDFLINETKEVIRESSIF